MKRFSPTIPCLLVALAAGFLAAGLLFSRSVFSATVNTSGSVSLPNLSKGLVGWWTMDEKDNLSPTGINDRSGNGNLGTLNGGVSKVSGKIGQGMKFDGNVSNDSKINCGLGTSLNLPSRVTLSGWVYPTRIGGGAGYYPMLFGKGYAAAGGYSMHIRSDGSLWFEIDDSDGTRHYYHPTNIYLSTNKWVHVVATYDGTTQRIYVNGVQDGTGQVISSDFGSTVPYCSIGWVSGGDYFTGSLDDVRVYNRALSALEIQQLYKLGGGIVTNKSETTKPSLNSGLVGYWTFDVKDRTATKALDKQTNTTTANATFYGGVFSSAGKVGQGIEIRGTEDDTAKTDYALVASSDQCKFRDLTCGDKTISTWVYFKKFNAIYGNAFLGTTYTGGGGPINNTGGWVLFSNSVGAPIQFKWYDASNEYYLSSGSITTNKWYLVTVTTRAIDASHISASLYVNGVLQASTSSASFDNTLSFYASNNLTIGAPSSGNYGTNDKIDDVRVYNRALSATEIQQLYKQGGGIITSKSETAKPNLNSGLVGYWTFDGKDWASPTVLVDKSGNGNSGTLNGGVSKVSGKVGQAMKFDGTNGFIDVGQPTNLDITGNISLTAWVKLPNLLASEPMIINKYNPSTPAGYGLYTSQTTGLVHFLAWGTSPGYATSDSSITANKWYHLVGVYDGAAMKIYINGVLDKNTPSTGTITSVAQNFNIGRSALGAFYSNGSVDDVRVYNRALSAQEVYQLYKMGK